MKFKSGDLVNLSPLAGKYTKIYDDPSLVIGMSAGYISQKDLAIVIDVSSHDCKSIKILSKERLGWIPGAFLIKIIE